MTKATAVVLGLLASLVVVLLVFGPFIGARIMLWYLLDI